MNTAGEASVEQGSSAPATSQGRGRLLLLAVWLLAVALLLGCDEHERAGDRAFPEPEAKIVGPEELVFDWSRQACEAIDYPDLPARAFRNANGRVQLLVSHYVNRRLRGKGLNRRLFHDCGAVMSSDFDGDPANFNDREWLASTYTLNGRTVFALVHNEYQGHRHRGQCPSGVYRRCWYNAITLARSDDGGRSYAQALPPANLVAVTPYRYAPDGGPSGILMPSNIVRNARDGHYYAFVTVRHEGAQERGSCLMRTRNLGDPRSWRAWDGRDFTVTFVDPYRPGPKTPAAHTCKPVALDEIQEMGQGLIYSTHFQQWLLVGRAGQYDPRRRRTVWGVYFSLSKDLLHWSRRRLMMEAELTSTYHCGDRDPIAYPTIIDPGSSSRNFETTGKRAYLYYTRSNYDSCRQTPDRDLVRIPIEFE